MPRIDIDDVVEFVREDPNHPVSRSWAEMLLDYDVYEDESCYSLSDFQDRAHVILAERYMPAEEEYYLAWVADKGGWDA